MACGGLVESSSDTLGFGTGLRRQRALGGLGSLGRSCFAVLSCCPRPPNVPLLRALWSLLDGIWGVLEGSWGVLVHVVSLILRAN